MLDAKKNLKEAIGVILGFIMPAVWLQNLHI